MLIIQQLVKCAFLVLEVRRSKYFLQLLSALRAEAAGDCLHFRQQLTSLFYVLVPEQISFRRSDTIWLSWIFK